MRILGTFLKNSVLAASVCAAFSVNAIAGGVHMDPLPTTNPVPQWLGSDLITAFHLNSNVDLALKCGTVYMGTIDVSKSSNSSIQSTGCNGNNPVIINANPINGVWSVYSGNIYQAYVDLKDHSGGMHDVAQVFADSQFLPPSHYPESYSESPTSTEPGWLQYNPSSMPPYSTATAFTFPFFGLPNNDIVGAQLTYRGNNNPYQIGTRTVSSYSNGNITLAPITDYDLPSEDPGSVRRFYLEGKLWMLMNSKNQAGWAYDHNSHMLYVRMSDGGSPNGRIYAGPFTRRVIDARGSANVLIKNVRVVGGDIGVDGGWSDLAAAAASDLHIYNSEVNYSNFAAVYATNTVRFSMAYSKVVGALHSGVYARDASTGASFTGNQFDYIGNVGMHKGGVAAIFVNNDSAPLVASNTFNQIGKTAIWTGASTYAVVNSNTINGACIIHGDCGGIYLISRSHAPLIARVHHNTVQGVTGVVGMRVGGDPTNLERYAIYLDDYTSNVDVYDNQILNNATGMQIHHGISNRIMGNYFSGNTQRHILFSNSMADADKSGIGGNNYIGTGANVSGFVGVAGGNTFVGPVQAFLIATETLSSAQATATFLGNTYQNYLGVSIGSPSLNYH